LSLPEALAMSSGIVHHGGLATAEAALGVGRPQFLFPLHLEQFLTTHAIEEMGCGINVARQKTEPGELIRRALKLGTHGKAAASVAGQVERRPKVDVLDEIVKACQRRLA
jgi:UDP:flavonoid glycosyltransferase YjiC (YdhE family)